jgi:hypothetical protein
VLFGGSKGLLSAAVLHTAAPGFEQMPNFHQVEPAIKTMVDGPWLYCYNQDLVQSTGESSRLPQ